MMPTLDTVSGAVARIDAWLETMRGPGGYGGPVVHWWQHCLQFTGAGLDWRYEGLITGYLNLYRATGDHHWRDKAIRAGEDLVQGQLATGNFRNSCFEANPYTGGTPHEAACDFGLLRLAQVLRAEQSPTWRRYHDAAERNLRAYFVAALWDAGAQAFRDHPTISSLVPNKAATLVEALLLLAETTGDASWADLYALPTLDAVLAHQVRGGPLDGAIAQYSTRGQPAAKYLPYYIARCIPALVAGYEQCGDERYRDGARRALAFVLRQRDVDGAFPQVLYPGGRVNRYPRWIAATGDILRALACLRPYGDFGDPAPTLAWLLQGQLPSGGIQTAHGFAAQASQRRPGDLPACYDLLPVVGWTAMAFRYLTHLLAATTTGSVRIPQVTGVWDTPLPCQIQGRTLIFRETATALTLARNGKYVYRWAKGAPWAEQCTARGAAI
ncbi:MAG: hypothetical protein JXB35_11835 [Anaerolineae bacterium]|nr:hypothetical protein [Anaerolineae bacterium]